MWIFFRPRGFRRQKKKKKKKKEKKWHFFLNSPSGILSFGGCIGILGGWIGDKDLAYCPFDARDNGNLNKDYTHRPSKDKSKPNAVSVPRLFNANDKGKLNMVSVRRPFDA